MSELIQYAELARSILGNSTPYSFTKRAIRSLFETSTSLSYQELTALRLTVIDSYYSTNMNKRYYGIEDITSALVEAGADNGELSNFFLDYIQHPSPDRKGSKLFNGIYGINKDGKPAKKAQSLISKYAYFITNFHFPIYDSLAKGSYRRLSKVYSDIVQPCSKIDDDVDRFFECIGRLNLLFKNYDLLDNLLWLIGKVKEGNLSLIMKRSGYEALTDICKGKLSYEQLIALSAEGGMASSIIGNDLCSFINFVRQLP